MAMFIGLVLMMILMMKRVTLYLIMLLRDLMNLIGLLFKQVLSI